MYGEKYTHLENEDQEILRLASAMIDQIEGNSIETTEICYRPGDYAYKTMARAIS